MSRNRGWYPFLLGASPDETAVQHRQRVGMGDPLKQDLQLGRLAGVRIGLNWSVLVAVVLFAWTLGVGVFPDAAPGRAGGVYAAMAAAGVFLLFASIAAHELGHALQARRDGVQIEEITLWAFGGVARFRQKLPSAGVELRMALAGPAVSVALGGVFATLAVALRRWDPAHQVAAWLGYVNLAIGAFNMVPAFPLDGGRVLRALLWRSKGDLKSATQAAARVGMATGYGFAILGGMVVIAGGDLGGLWLAAIGLFVVNAARAEAQQVFFDARFRDLTVAEIMTRNPVRVADDDLVAEALASIARSRHGVYPVVDAGERPVGALAMRDVARLSSAARSIARVTEQMRPIGAETIVDVGAPALDAVAAIATSPISRVFAVERDRLVGVVSASDLIWMMHVGALSGRQPANRTTSDVPTVGAPR